MKIAAFALLLLTCACVPGRELMTDIHAGMPRAEAIAKLGQPHTIQPSTTMRGAECATYDLYRPFLERRRGQPYSDRYFVCFRDDRVVTFGRVGDNF